MSGPPRMLGRAAGALLSVAALGWVGGGCSGDDDRRVTATTSLIGPRAPEELLEEQQATQRPPFGVGLQLVPVTGTDAAVRPGGGAVQVHDRSRSAVLFSAGDEGILVAEMRTGVPHVFELAPAFDATAGRSLVARPLALCFQSAIGLVEGGGDTFAAKIALDTQEEQWSVPVVGGGGPLGCGGGTIAVAGAGRDTVGIHWREGQTFWAVPLELDRAPVVNGDVAYAPTSDAVVGLDVQSGVERWRVDGRARSPLVVGAAGAWVEFSDEFRFVSPDGEEMATFDRDELLAEVEAHTGEPLDSARLRVGGSAGSPVLVFTGTDVVMALDGSFRELGAAASEELRIVATSDELLWAVSGTASAGAGVAAEEVQLIGVDGTLVNALAIEGEAFETVVAADQFVLGARGSGLAYVLRR